MGISQSAAEVNRLLDRMAAASHELGEARALFHQATGILGANLAPRLQALINEKVEEAALARVVNEWHQGLDDEITLLRELAAQLREGCPICDAEDHGIGHHAAELTVELVADPRIDVYPCCGGPMSGLGAGHSRRCPARPRERG